VSTVQKKAVYEYATRKQYNYQAETSRIKLPEPGHLDDHTLRIRCRHWLKRPYSEALAKK